MKVKLKTYLHHPGSLVVLLLTILSAVITVLALGSLIVYILVKGVRNCADWELENQMARINAGICPGLETVLLPASAAYEHFSSTMVREMIRYHQPLEKYVPAPVAEELMRQRG